MRLSFPVFALSLILAAGSALADPDSSSTYQVQSPHGGYNVIQGNAPHAGLAFFGAGGFASSVVAHSHDKPKFILKAGLEDDGHGKKIVVYKKVYYATAEDAEAARLKQ